MYILQLSNGQQFEFYVLSCAEIFQQAHGGTITHASHILAAA